MKEKILIVGNADPKQSFSNIVKRYDHVLRMNMFRTKGFEETIGSKTTIIASNRQVNFNDIERHSDSSIWVMRDRTYIKNEAIAKSYEGLDYKVIIDSDFVSKGIAVLDGKQEFYHLLRNAEMGKTTLGFCVVIRALIDGYKPVLINFDFGETPHYFNHAQGRGWEGHDWSSERECINYLREKGLVEFIDVSTALSERAVVCVLCWGDEDCLRITFEEFIQNEPDKNVRFFVYFQECNEKSRQIVNDFEDIIDYYYMNEGNSGNSIPRNKMVSIAKERGYGYIGFLDADIVPNKKSFSYFLEFLNKVETYDAVTSYCQEKVSDLHDPKGIYVQPEIAHWQVDHNFFSIGGNFPCFPSQNSLWRIESLENVFFPEYHPFDKPGWGAEDNIAGYNYMYDRPGKIATVLEPKYRHLLHSSWHKLDFETNVFERCLHFEFYRHFFTQEERKKINNLQSFPRIVVNFSHNILTRKFCEHCSFIDFSGSEIYPDRMGLSDIDFSGNFKYITEEDWKQIFAMITSLNDNREHLALDFNYEA